MQTPTPDQIIIAINQLKDYVARENNASELERRIVDVIDELSRAVTHLQTEQADAGRKTDARIKAFEEDVVRKTLL